MILIFSDICTATQQILRENMHKNSIMHVFWICLVLCVGSSLCINDIEFERIYEDSYDNEISLDQPEGESPTATCQTDFSRWDKLFVALEDSHMRQNMLLESVEQCCKGTTSLKTQLEKLTKGVCQQCAPSLEAACKVHAEQASLRLHKDLVDLRDEEEEKERRLNATLQMLLRNRHQDDAWLKRLEEIISSSSADSSMRSQPTPRPDVLGMKLFTSGLKEQEVSLPVDMVTVESTLAAIATELQRIHKQLNKVIEQVGTLGKGRGDT